MSNTTEEKTCWYNIGCEMVIVKESVKGQYFKTDYPHAASERAAREWAKELNTRMDIDEDEQLRIVGQSMF